LPQVTADVVQLQQVVLNLMLNACDAMTSNPPGDRVLTLGAIDLDGVVRLSVADCGCGLPAGDEERIFEPFFSTKPEGLGMGLAICRSIAIAHGGRLVVAPVATGGTVFYLDLPVAGARSS
jgi:signal transduction histidine kinase